MDIHTYAHTHTHTHTYISACFSIRRGTGAVFFVSTLFAALFALGIFAPNTFNGGSDYTFDVVFSSYLDQVSVRSRVLCMGMIICVYDEFVYVMFTCVMHVCMCICEFFFTMYTWLCNVCVGV